MEAHETIGSLGQACQLPGPARPLGVDGQSGHEDVDEGKSGEKMGRSRPTVHNPLSYPANTGPAIQLISIRRLPLCSATIRSDKSGRHVDGQKAMQQAAGRFRWWGRTASAAPAAYPLRGNYDTFVGTFVQTIKDPMKCCPDLQFWFRRLETNRLGQ
jgi:hypothetical protein